MVQLGEAAFFKETKGSEQTAIRRGHHNQQATATKVGLDDGPHAVHVVCLLPMQPTWCADSESVQSGLAWGKWLSMNALAADRAEKGIPSDLTSGGPADWLKSSASQPTSSDNKLSKRIWYGVAFVILVGFQASSSATISRRQGHPELNTWKMYH
eukprot:1011257-Pyramimonas_sp.AAC.2